MKLFIIADRKGEMVLGAPVSEDNAYISAYGSVEAGCTAVADLAIGETTRKTYALSGQKPTTYWITRTDDKEGM